MVKEVNLAKEVYHEISIENAYLKFSCLDYGATVTRLESKDKNGEFTSNIVTFSDLEEYVNNGSYLGAIVAPLPGRIKNHEVMLNGEKFTLDNNEGNTCLHGGKDGYSFKRFNYEVTENSIILSREEVSPINNALIDFKVIYTLKDNTLEIKYLVKADHDTYFSATNHTYFNLGGSLLDHYLYIDSNYFLTLDSEGVGSNHMSEVYGGHVFNKMAKIGTMLELDLDSKERTKGLDHAYMLFDGENAITLTSEASGKKLILSTDEESVVVYSGSYLKEPYAGIAFEPQAIPNGMNTKLSDAWFLKKDCLRESITSLTFEVAHA